MNLPIVLWPSAVLDTPTLAVTDFAALPGLLVQMEAAMREADGIGIAANQVGLPLRFAIVGRDDGTWFEIVNPVMLSKEEPIVLDEGCLSLPGEWHDVSRFRKVRVRFQDRSGTWQELDAEDKLAHVLQHEIDHLDGRVYAFHLAPLKKKLVRERMLKRQKVRARRPDET
jgi:peptide deformylase